jgi:apolipoprotein N-acyltransferase
LHVVQRVLQVALCVGALAAAVVPRRKSPLQLAALTAALLAGFELVLTYWLYTYIPWFFPFAAVAVLAPAVVRAHVPVEDAPVERPQLAPAH